MIDPIDDHSEDLGADAEPGRSWADCPMLARGDMLALIERNKDLDGRAVNLFRNALEGKPRSDLFEHYIGPNLLPSRFPLHLHDPRSEPISVQGMAIGLANITTVL